MKKADRGLEILSDCLTFSAVIRFGVRADNLTEMYNTPDGLNPFDTWTGVTLALTWETRQVISADPLGR